MNRMMKKLKLASAVSCLIGTAMIISCGPKLVDAVDQEEQFAIDVELIEDYLSKKGYTDYDTLEGGERVLVLDEGTGEEMQFEDIITYHYLGKFLNDTIFDTSLAQAAFDQDTISANSEIEFMDDGEGGYVYDINGLPRLNRQPSYRPGYEPIYSFADVYQPYAVTHTAGGWAAQQQSLISGFKNGLVYTLDNTRIGGRAVVIIPSYLAYGITGSGSIPPRTVIMFELRPIKRR